MTSPRISQVVAKAVHVKGWIGQHITEPTWFYLGFLDPNGQPANSKIVYTVAVAVSLTLVYKLGIRQIDNLKGQLSVEYVALLCLVLLFCASIEAFKKLVSAKFGGEAKPEPPPPPAAP